MPDNSQFVMPKAQMDDLVARTGGDVGKLEQALGIPEGAWTNREMVQINIATPRDFNVRMPSGNEMGANNLWLPGGRLPTGQLEAVVDQIPKGGYTESLLPQAGKNLTPSNAPALNLAPAGHGMKPVTNPPAPATPVKAHTSANQANQGSHPVADPGASPTVKRAINALQEGSPDTRIGKTELQFREAVEGGAKGVGVANSEGAGVLFGQKRVGPTFGVEGRPSYLAGREISDVAADLHAGRLHPDQLRIDAFEYNGQLVSANTRSLSALSEAGLQPTNINIIKPSRALLERLQEAPLLPNAPLPGPRVPVTPSQRDLTILRVIEMPGGR